MREALLQETLKTNKHSLTKTMVTKQLIITTCTVIKSKTITIIQVTTRTYMCMDKKVVKLTAQHNNKNSTIETCAHFQLNTACILYPVLQKRKLGFEIVKSIAFLLKLYYCKKREILKEWLNQFRPWVDCLLLITFLYRQHLE